MIILLIGPEKQLRFNNFPPNVVLNDEAIDFIHSHGFRINTSGPSLTGDKLVYGFDALEYDRIVQHFRELYNSAGSLQAQ